MAKPLCIWTMRAAQVSTKLAVQGAAVESWVTLAVSISGLFERRVEFLLDMGQVLNRKNWYDLLVPQPCFYKLEAL